MSNSNLTSLIDLQIENPSSEIVIKKMKLELMTLRRIGVSKVKIVHGYGPLGNGCSVRNDVRAELLMLARKEKIRAFCPGELFGPFEKQGRHLLELDASFRNDSDWAKGNDNVTLVCI